MRRRSFVPLALVFALAAALPAQIVGPGLTWTGSGESTAGSHVPSCTNQRAAAYRGGYATVRVWGDLQSPFALFIAASATQCLPIPGIGNGLVLDLPVHTVAAGVLTRISPCMSCPPGMEALNLTIPLAIPLNAAVSFQAVAYGGNRPSLTVAITATVVQ